MKNSVLQVKQVSLLDFEQDLKSWRLVDKSRDNITGDLHYVFDTSFMGRLGVQVMAVPLADLLRDGLDVDGLKKRFAGRNLQFYCDGQTVFFPKIDYKSLASFGVQDGFESPLGNGRYREVTLSTVMAWLAFVPFKILFGFDFMGEQ